MHVCLDWPHMHIAGKLEAGSTWLDELKRELQVLGNTNWKSKCKSGEITSHLQKMGKFSAVFRRPCVSVCTVDALLLQKLRLYQGEITNRAILTSR